MKQNRRTRMAVLLLALLGNVTHAQWRSVADVEETIVHGKGNVTFRAGSASLNVHVLAGNLVRVRFRPAPGDTPDRSWAVIKTSWPEVPLTTKDTPSSCTISTAELTIVVHKHPCRVAILDKTGAPVVEDHAGKGMSWQGNEVRVWKTMPEDEHYYGFGEKPGRLERRDLHMTMWNSDIPAYTAATDPVYQSIPFFYGLRQGKAYGIFLDNSYRSSFDMGKEARDQFSFGAENGELNYYVFYGPSPRAILSRFTELVGRMPLPPLWSLGYQQCRWSYTPETRVRDIAAGFRSHAIPCDVIYLDIDYMDGYRIFTWNPSAFPSPGKLIRDLDSAGFKVAVIVDPGIKVDSAYAAFRTGLTGNHFVRYPDGKLYTGRVWPGVCAFPDFTSAAARRWWGDQFAGLAEDGVRGWWNDMNEPSVFDVPTKTIDLNVLHDDEGLKTSHAKNHNIYGMEMTRATYEGIRRHLPTERPFVLTRASYAGGWRYSAAWTGDNVASWDHLTMSLAMCLNLSISGQPFVGSDIGGFIGYPSGELFTRWLQLGVFTPLMRAHSAINEKNKEPWEFGADCTAINRETINLRYRLLPYIYTTMAEAAASGIPAMRPMAFDYAEDERLADNDTQFMFGPDVLVAPVLEPGSTARSVDLPRGLWYDFWTGQKLEGGRRATVSAPINRIPFFLRAGTVLPMRDLVQYTGQSPIRQLTLRAYPPGPGTTATSPYYEDDGRSFQYQVGEHFRRSCTLTSDIAGCTLVISAVEGTYTPPPRDLVIVFSGISREPASVTVGGKSLTARGREVGVTGGSGWEYRAGTNSVTVTMPDVAQSTVIALRY